MKMQNVSGTPEYKAYREEYLSIFDPRNQREQEELPLGSGYRLRRRSFRGDLLGYSIHASESDLLDSGGQLLFTYQNLNDDAEFAALIEHQNGGRYFLFRTELYGYGVYHLESGKRFDYIPSGSFPSGETFIWCGVNYFAQKNLLTVSGCYWACPFGTLLLDFTDPMAEHEWVDLQEKIDKGYDRYDDMDFKEWRGLDLVLDCASCESGAREEVVIPAQQYEAWLNRTQI